MDEQKEVEVNGYILKEFDEKTLWLENPDGEGMQINKSFVEEKLEQLFKEQF